MFRRVMADKGGTTTLMDIPAGAAEYVRGQALYMNNGVATACAGDIKATYIAMESKTAKAGEMLRVARVADDEIYETTLAVAGEGLVEGDRVTFAANGEGVTATEGDKGAEIVAFDGKEAGDIVRVRL